MTLRLEYGTISPEAIRALNGLNRYSDCCSIDPKLRRLLEILVSQINLCTYCVNTHTNQALDIGEVQGRIDAIVGWRIASVFSTEEKVAFAWCEAVTQISSSGAPDHLYKDLQKYFSEIEIIDLTFIILSMNAWNRLAISFKRDA